MGLVTTEKHFDPSTSVPGDLSIMHQALAQSPTGSIFVLAVIFTCATRRYMAGSGS